MKKILVVQGGGRANGNTAQLVSHFVKGAEESGHSVEVVSLILRDFIVSQRKIPTHHWVICKILG